VINGPNLNFLGIRNQAMYGQKTYKNLVEMIESYSKKINVEVMCYQSNHEGAIIDRLQQAYHEKVTGVIINPGAFTHYSYAIRDGIESIQLPTVEVHISDIYQREKFRQISVVTSVCKHKIVGKGLDGYIEAIDYLVQNYQ